MTILCLLERYLSVPELSPVPFRAPLRPFPWHFLGVHSDSVELAPGSGCSAPERAAEEQAAEEQAPEQERPAEEQAPEQERPAEEQGSKQAPEQERSAGY